MKKINSFKKILPLLLVAITAVSCNDKFEELQKNPNAAGTSAPINLLHGIIEDTWDKPWEETQRYCQFYATGFSLYDSQNYMFGTLSNDSYTPLRNIQRMEIEAEKNGTEEVRPFLAIAKFFKAYTFIRLSERLGDIPMSEATQGETTGNFTPKYDTQEDVYKQSLLLLEEANRDIAQYVGKVQFATDLYFGGDLLKWQKAINSFRLRVLMSLSKRAEDGTIDVKAQFAKIMNDPATYPVMTSGADNMQIVYPGSTTDRYPTYPDESKQHKQRHAIGETYVKILRETEDPRIFSQMVPGDKVNEDVEGREKMFSSYIGANTGDLMATILTGINTGQYATINYDLYVTPTGIPTVQLGYPEIEFTIAEAINRGWIAGNAAAHYENGIRADMKFYDVSDSQINDFMQKNAYKGDNADGLKQILTQKYVAFFQNSGYEPFFNQRRTGIPEFNVGPGNDNGKIPLRWMYPDNERLYNKVNLETSLKRQFGGSDNINDAMWLIK